MMLSYDYSRFAELHKQTAVRREAHDALTKWVDEEQIEVRCSSVNVLEAGPLTKDAIALAQGRLDAIYRLCGKKYLIDGTGVGWSGKEGHPTGPQR